MLVLFVGFVCVVGKGDYEINLMSSGSMGWIHTRVLQMYTHMNTTTDLDEAVAEAPAAAPLLDDARGLQLPKLLEQVLFVVF